MTAFPSTVREGVLDATGDEQPVAEAAVAKAREEATLEATRPAPQGVHLKASVVRDVPVVVQEGAVARPAPQAEAEAIMGRAVIIPLAEGDVRRLMGAPRALTILTYATSNARAPLAKAARPRDLGAVRAPRVDIAGPVPQVVARAPATLTKASERQEVGPAVAAWMWVDPVIGAAASAAARGPGHHRPREGPGPVILVPRDGVVGEASRVPAVPPPGLPAPARAIAPALAVRASPGRGAPGPPANAAGRATRPGRGPP